jgi:hypothetical protein
VAPTVVLKGESHSSPVVESVLLGEDIDLFKKLREIIFKDHYQCLFDHRKASIPSFSYKTPDDAVDNGLLKSSQKNNKIKENMINDVDDDSDDVKFNRNGSTEFPPVVHRPPLAHPWIVWLARKVMPFA